MQWDLRHAHYNCVALVKVAILICVLRSGRCRFTNAPEPVLFGSFGLLCVGQGAAHRKALWIYYMNLLSVTNCLSMFPFWTPELRISSTMMLLQRSKPQARLHGCCASWFSWVHWNILESNCDCRRLTDFELCHVHGSSNSIGELLVLDFHSFRSFLHTLGAQ
jgi:hypothetical protein